jgi:amidase
MPSIRKGVYAAGKALADLGFPVDQFRPEGLEHAPNLWNFFFGQLVAKSMKDRIAGREAEAHWTYTENLERTDRLGDQAPITAWQVIESMAARDAMRRRLLKQMRRVGVLLTPVSSIAAFRHRERKFMIPSNDSSAEGKKIGLFQAMMTVTPINLLGLPALVVPFGMTEEGLPIGVQLIGRPWEEELLLEIGVRLENARGPLPNVLS